MTKVQGSKDRRMRTLWEPVEASPEQIARVCMEGPPKEKWDYLKHWHVWFYQVGEPPDWLKEEWAAEDPEYDQPQALGNIRWALYRDEKPFTYPMQARRYGAKVEADPTMYQVRQCVHADCAAEGVGRARPTGEL